jgi:hypothetical protein
MVVIIVVVLFVMREEVGAKNVDVGIYQSRI